MKQSDTLHLLRRAGFGASDSEVLAYRDLSLAEAVERATQIDGGPTEDDVPQVAGENKGEERRYLASWWLDQMASSPAPIVERLTYFWHSHFACSIRRVDDMRLMRAQHVLFRTAGLGPFRQLLHQVAIDPAMLIDLDNASNFRGREQENFARELMELYTLGVGNFTEHDVVEMARAWTGHSLLHNPKPETYLFKPWLHDHSSKTILGVTRYWNGPETIDELVDGEGKDRTSRHLVSKLWREFGDPGWSSPELIDRLAATWRASDGNALEVVRAIFLSDEFWSTQRRYSMVTPPVAYITNLRRRTGVTLPSRLGDLALAGMDHSLFTPPTVAGWGHNDYWLTSSSLQIRAYVAHRLSGEVSQRGLLTNLRHDSPAAATDRIFALFGVPDASDQSRSTTMEWCAAARSVLTNAQFEREAFRYGALLPEVNLS